MVRERTFAEALEHRRSYYSISNDSPVQEDVYKRQVDILLQNNLMVVVFVC